MRHASALKIHHNLGLNMIKKRFSNNSHGEDDVVQENKSWHNAVQQVHQKRLEHLQIFDEQPDVNALCVLKR
jgi:hypothetical protein